MSIGRRIQQLEEALSSYRYPLPFSQHLRDYFRRHKNMGSKDRKELRQLSYAWFRMGHALKSLPLGEQAIIARELLERTPFNSFDALNARLNELISNALSLQAKDIFPWTQEVTEQLNNDEFYLSYLNQPWVWIKIKKAEVRQVVQDLEAAQIPYLEYRPGILRVHPEAKLDTLQSFQRSLFRIQDLSSQQTAQAFQTAPHETWWDACSGAGGKSLGLMEQEPSIHLYASDVRESILENLKQRHDAFGTRNLKTFRANLEEPLRLDLPAFDGIITDVPCSGSGTWARNPENLVYFDPKSIASYQKKQLNIVRHALPFLKPGKPLIYITCSIFKAENEDVIHLISQEFPVEIEEQKYLEGYREGAENMFLCRLIRKA